MCQRFTCLISFTLVFVLSVPASGQYWRGWPQSVVVDWGFESLDERNWPPNVRASDVLIHNRDIADVDAARHFLLEPDGPLESDWTPSEISGDPVLVDYLKWHGHPDPFSDMSGFGTADLVSESIRLQIPHTYSFRDGAFWNSRMTSGEFNDSPVDVMMPAFQISNTKELVHIGADVIIPRSHSGESFTVDSIFPTNHWMSTYMDFDVPLLEDYGGAGLTLGFDSTSQRLDRSVEVVESAVDYEKRHIEELWRITPSIGSRETIVPSGLSDVVHRQRFGGLPIGMRILFGIEGGVGLERLTIDSWAIDDVSSHAWTVQGAREAARSHAGLEGVLTIPEPPTGLMFAVIICVALLFGIFFNRRED